MSGEALLVLRLILAALLYLFLGVAFYVIWRDLSQRSRQSIAQPTPAKLIVEEGAQAGQSLPLRAVTTVGRADNNPIVVNDAFASSHHAMILWREHTWWLEDLESHNGTFLNNNRITEPSALTSGDHIRIGETVLCFEMTSIPTPLSLEGDA